MKTLLLLIAFTLGLSVWSNAQQVSAYNTSAVGLCNGSAVLLDSLNVNPASVYWYSTVSEIDQGTYYTSGLCAGTYTVTYTDSLGVSQTATFVISSGTGDPCAGFQVFIGTYSNTDTVNCNGTAFAFLSGGTAPFTYSWNAPTFGTATSITGLCSGLYTCVVTDANGCTYTAQASVNDSLGNSQCAGFYATASVYPSTNSLTCNGMIDVMASGGTAPYTYFPETGEAFSTGSFQGLCPGTYVVVVADANGCYYSVASTVVDSSLYFADSTNIIDNPTYGDSTITDTLDYSWIYDCTFDLGSVDSAMVIDSFVSGADSVYVTWVLIDSTGVVLGTYSVGYATGGATGVVTVFLTVVCPQHSQGVNSLWASDQIYLQEGPLGLTKLDQSDLSIVNPFNETLDMKFSSELQRGISLMDLSGKVILTTETDQKSFSWNTAELSKGMYVLLIKENGQYISRKLVK